MITSEQLALRLFRFLTGRSYHPGQWISDAEYELIIARLEILVDEWAISEEDLADLPYYWPESMEIVC